MGFVRNAIGLALTSGATAAVGFATSVLLARFLSVEDRGVYAVATVFAALTVIVAKLGLPSAVVYRLRRARVPPGRVVGTVTLLALALGGVAVVLCALFAPDLQARFFTGAPPAVYAIALGLVPLQLLAAVYVGVAGGIDRFALRNAYAAGLTTATCAALAWILVVRGGGLVDALAGLLVVQALATLGLVAATVRATGIALRPDPGEIARSLRFGSKSYLQALAGQVHERVDVFMLAALLRDPGQVAYYAIAAGVIDRLKLLPDAIATAAYPEMAGLDARRASRLACAASRQSTASVVATALPLAVAAPLLIPWVYGEPYRASVAPFLILLPGMALLTVYRVLSRYFTAMNRQQANIVTQVLSVLVNVGLNWLWIPRFGVVGAAAASVVSYSLEAVLITAVFLRVSRRSLRETLLPRRDDVAVYFARLRAALRRAPEGSRTDA